MKTKLLTIFSLLMVALSLQASASPTGVWERSDKKSTIILKVENGKLSGYISKISDPKRTHDTKNPEAKFRGRRLVGLKIISGFSEGSDGKWAGGTVYDSSKGKTSKGKIWLEKGKLMMRSSLMGRTATWNRLK